MKFAKISFVRLSVCCKIGMDANRVILQKRIFKSKNYQFLLL